MSNPSLDGFPFQTSREVTPIDSEKSTSPEQELGSSWNSVEDLTYGFDVNAFNPFAFPDVPQNVLHHTPSTSSLSSLSSNGLLVYPEPDLLDKSNMPVMDIYNTRQVPKLEVQTQGLRTARMRSSSRVTPYDLRERSQSVGANSDDDVTALLSSTSNSVFTPWTASSLAGGFTKMTLHHRRTSSSTSVKPSPMLSRTRRSTMGLRESSSSLDLHGTASEREEAVRRELVSLADSMRSLPTASQQDKARSTWVRKWFILSYTHSVGHTVPRQGLYHSYTLSCQAYGVKPINSASFGKAVRSAFPGIKTRRLGVRGNSKYHYVAIRPAVRIEAERLNAYGDSSGQWHVAPEDGSMGFHASEEIDIDEDVEDTEFEEDEEYISPVKTSPERFYSPHSRSTSDPFTRPSGAFVRRHTTSALPSIPAQTPVYNLPGFPSLNGVITELPHDAVQRFWDAFCRFQEDLSAYVRESRYERYESHCRAFWSSQSPQLVSHPLISGMISDAMAVSYDNLMSTLMDKLTGPLPGGDALRHLAAQLECIMEDCFRALPNDFSAPKIEQTVRVAHLILRYLDLHQLTIALNPILSNSAQVRDMLAAWDQLNVTGLADQCALSCNCQQELIERILSEFHAWLADLESSPRHAVDRLGAWIEKTMSEAGTPLKTLVPRAGYVTSQVMRDFTLKSEKSFGLFQLIKTWVDDYVAILAVRKTGLSSKSVETGMSVIIPSQGPADLSLSTAVPMDYQYLPMPALESSLVTPRPFAQDNF